MIAVVGDSQTLAGFGLAGIKQLIQLETDPDQIIQQLLKVKLAILTPQAAQKLGDRLEKLRSLNPELAIVELPDPRSPLELDRLSEFIKRKIGVEIR